MFRLATLGVVLFAALHAYPQNASPASADKPAGPEAATAQSATPPTPAALPTPSTVGPLQLSPPINFEAGFLGKLSLNGAVSGIGLFQNNPVSGNNPQEGAFSNAMLFLQKADGWFQFYVQAGTYDVVSLGSPFIS